MKAFIHWTTSAYQADDPLAISSNHLILAYNVQRYKQFYSGYSMKLPLKGGLPYRVDNQLIEIQPSRYFLTNYGREMECLPCQPGAETLLVTFSPDLLCDVVSNHHFSHQMLLENHKTNRQHIHFCENSYAISHTLHFYLQTLVAEMRAYEQDYSTSSADIFFHLAAHVLKEQAVIQKQIEQVNATYRVTREELYRRAAAAYEFLCDQWDSNLSLEEIARHACLSPFHFNRTFREIYGQAPIAFFKSIKLQKARHLLASGQWNITEVALRCGYNDVQTFSKAFKRAWKIPPSAVIADA
ncbi:MAG TPA: helix-turn-helix transcriptional regulator [Saprospiraceae bacterium]|nr:helix-turn-helix transcriptional regulator [Saprospiraceae bacterium]HMQ82766.1 helix-turn-helix transcriptional regulator [Saprospiraceae bacterium]